MTTPVTDAAGTKLRFSRRLAHMWRELRRSVLWRILVQQRAWIIASLVLGIVRAVLLNATLGASRLAIDDAIIEHTIPLGPVLQRLVILAFLSFAFGLLSSMVGDKIGWTIEYTLRNWIYDRLQRIPPRSLDSLTTGQLIARTGSDLNAVERFIGFLPTILTFFPFLLVLPIIAISINWYLSIFAIAGLPLTIWIVNRIKGRMWGFNYLRTNQKALVANDFDESVRGIRVVKAYGREDEAHRRVEESTRKEYQYEVTQAKFLAKFDVLLEVVPSGLRAGIYVFGALLVIAWGQLTVGTLLVFIRITRGISGFTTGLDEMVNAWQYVKTALGRVQELITWAPTERNTQETEPLPEPTTGLELDAVGVELGGRPVLSEINLRAQAGELVAVSGPRGSGKSTLAAVITGEVRPSDGVVILDGSEIERIDYPDLRHAVRLVPEDPFFFSRTLRENLEMGTSSRRLSPERMEAALYAAHALDVVEDLDDGYDTVLGDRALTLSGGQRQRLALARALVEPPRVLLLDDALAAVPPATEVEILRRIREYAPTTAVVSLSRRSSHENGADRVVQLPAPPAEEPGDAPDREAPALRDGPYTAALLPHLADITVPDLRPPIAEEKCLDPVTRPHMWPTLAPLKGKVAVVALFLLAYTIVGLAPERITGLLSDALDQENLDAAIFWGLAALFIGTTQGLTRAAFKIYQAKFDGTLIYMMRRRLFSRLMTLGVDYYDREPAGQTATRVVYDFGQVSYFIENGLFRFLTTGALIVFSLGVAVALAPGVALMASVFIPVVAILTAIEAPLLSRAYTKVRIHSGNLLTRLHEDFSGRYVVKSFNKERRSRRDYNEVNWSIRNAQREAAVIKNIYGEFIDIAGALASVVIFWQAGQQVIAGALSIGILVSVEAYIDDVVRRTPALGRLVQWFLRVRVSMKKLDEVYDAPILPDESPPSGGQPRPVPSPPDGGITFEHVSFSYPHTGKEVLTDLSIDIAAGETIAFVGQTGAGKSSLAKLVSRIYDPTEGRILLDGTDIREFDLRDYRRHIGVVPQDDFVFRGTVWDNVAYARPGVSQEDVETAAIAIGAYDRLLAVPGGVVEEHGRNLTLAQRQLIGLARAWITSPDIVVLDEATSALDDDAEAAALDAFLGLGRTTIMVTHRESAAKRADLIVVVERGHLVEAGTYDELKANEGWYSRLWIPEAPAKPTRSRSRAKTKTASRSRGNGRPRASRGKDAE